MEVPIFFISDSFFFCLFFSFAFFFFCLFLCVDFIIITLHYTRFALKSEHKEKRNAIWSRGIVICCAGKGWNRLLGFFWGKRLKKQNAMRIFFLFARSVLQKQFQELKKKRKPKKNLPRTQHPLPLAKFSKVVFQRLQKKVKYLTFKPQPRTSVPLLPPHPPQQ